jgi:hypothetical protein
MTVSVQVLATAAFTLRKSREYKYSCFNSAKHCSSLRSSLFWVVTRLRFRVTDVSLQPFGPMSKNMDYMTLANGLPRNVGNYKSTPHNILVERRSHLYRGGSL